ncbi:kinetochore protein Spc25-like [Musca vetustissima]|uniref:kinetochore protein Spc25-like n=1 Tax=Musca vetustissima TaxID=27455 RepID=UPI002AB7CE36|nr:kinetochore protein Spc25-like [Musca vetustissima]
MSKYDFSKRLKRMLNNECEIVEMETNVARKCAKHYEQMTQLKTMLNAQEHELNRYRNSVDRLKHETEELEKFVAGEEERLNCININIERLRGESKEMEQQRIVQRKQELTRREFIRRIKETTQMYFNEDALPYRFQGVCLERTETSYEWKPFAVDAKKWLNFLDEQWKLENHENKENSDNNRMDFYENAKH